MVRGPAVRTDVGERWLRSPRVGRTRAWGERVSAFLFRHPRAKLGLTLGAPITWLVVVYLGSLLFLLANAFWSLDVLTSEIVRGFSFGNFQTLWESGVYRTITIRTVSIAAAVTITDILLSFPLAYYTARMATPRMRNALLVAVVLPLWANYLVRIFAWKIMLTPNGFVNWLAELTGSRFAPARTIQLGRVADVRVPVAAVHAPADLRGARATPHVAPGGVVGPRGPRMDHLPRRHVPDDPARDRGGFDLRLLAHARRLHRARTRREHAIHRQRDLRQRRAWRGTRRSPPRSPSSRSPSWPCTCSARKRLGAFEAL